MPLPIAGRGPRPARGPVTHTFLVGPDQPLRALQITTPAGFEDFAAEVGQPAAELRLPRPGTDRSRRARPRRHHRLEGAVNWPNGADSVTNVAG